MVERWADRVRFAGLAGALASLAVALFASRHWPLVGDAALMHYVVLAMQHGQVLYRDLRDVNLPGTYFFELLGMHLFGPGAAGWRLYDALLLLLAIVASVLLGRRAGSGVAGLIGGAVFSLIHLQDGILQVGQRDLLIAVLLLWSYVALFAAETGKRSLQNILLFGMAFGVSATIKPVLLPLGLVLLGMAAWELRRHLVVWQVVSTGVSGMVLPMLACTFWLWRVGGLAPFLHSSRALLVLHASLGRLPAAYLLTHEVAPVGFVAAAWLLLLLSERTAISALRSQLYVGLAGAALAFLLQGKGLPYQRYPFLAILMLVLCLDLSRILSAGRWRSYAAASVLLVITFILAPTYAWTVCSFSPATPFQTALNSRLAQSGASANLSGQVQCLDTFGGCLGVLNENQIVQSSGFLYDCYLFTAPSATRDQYRSDFLAALLRKPPRVIIETDQFCFKYASGFSRVEQWPELNDLLARSYRVEPAWKSAELQHWWHRREMPVEFRIYRRRE